MAIIFAGSTDLMSADHTSRIIVPLLHWLFPTISGLTLLQVEFFIRKAAHVSEYAVLAVLLYRAFVHTVFQSRRALSAGIVLLSCAAYAASDEFHQSFVPMRSVDALDVVADAVGAAAAAFALYGWDIIRTRHAL